MYRSSKELANETATRALRGGVQVAVLPQDPANLAQNTSQRPAGRIPWSAEPKSAVSANFPSPVRVLELRSVMGTGGGPDKTILLGAARANPARYAVTVAYLRDARDPVFSMRDKAAALGIDYTEVLERHSADPSVVGRLRSLVRSRNIDIVHAHDYKTDLLALVLARTERVIPLSTAHGFSGHSWKERWLYYPLDRQLLARFPRVIAVSSDIGDMLAGAGVPRDRIRVILNGIDHRAFTRDEERRQSARDLLGLGPEDFAIGAIGRLEREKRYDLLIEAFSRVAATHPSVRLLIAGEGSLRASLQTDAMRLLGPGMVRFLGHHSDVLGLHHALDLFVQSSSNEGTPNAVLEAMALGTPVVATAVGGTPELIRDGVDGLLVAAGNATILADAIVRSLDDKAAGLSRAVSARSRVETDLSFDTRQDRLETIYDELIAAHGQPSAGRPSHA